MMKKWILDDDVARKDIRLPLKYGRAVLLTKILANTFTIYEKGISEQIIRWYCAPLVNQIDYVWHELGESNLQADRGPLVNQTDYLRNLKS